VLVIGQRKPMYSVLLLIASFGALSGLYVLLGSPFVAVISDHHLRGRQSWCSSSSSSCSSTCRPRRRHRRQARLIGGAGPRRFGAVLSVLLAIQLFWAFRAMTAQPMPGADGPPATTVREIGVRLFTAHAFAFEATSVLILVAMVGAIILARKEPRQ